LGVDSLIKIGRGQLHLRCEGAGDATVVLIAGWEDGGDDWGSVEPGLVDHARVCSYARFGTGTSDAPTNPQTFTTQADDLHELLDTAGEPGPYVIVGHSFGGVEAVAFASRYGANVKGLVLIDTSPATWPDATCAVPDDGSDAAAVFAATCIHMSDPMANVEHLDAVKAFREVRPLSTLGNLPMTVITRAAPSYAGLAPDAARELATTWAGGQNDWAKLSSAGRVVPVDTQDHYVHHANPALVVDEIRGLVL
jgi:pimeloyl-ACP methyl ester carboxylesterase